jgi:hypothetical protein
VREIVNKLGANLTQPTHLREVAQDEPRSTVTIWRCHNRDVSCLVGVPETTIAKINGPALHLTINSAPRELLKPEVNGRFDQRHSTKLNVAAREDLSSDGTRRADHEVGSNTKDGVISRLKEGVQALRAAISAIPSNFRSTALSRRTISLRRHILRRESANHEIGNSRRDEYRCEPNDKVRH